jgi:hypothetical protein
LLGGKLVGLQVGLHPNEAQDGQNEIIEVKLDEGIGCQRVDVSVFTEEEVSDEGSENEEVGVLGRR